MPNPGALRARVRVLALVSASAVLALGLSCKTEPTTPPDGGTELADTGDAAGDGEDAPGPADWEGFSPPGGGAGPDGGFAEKAPETRPPPKPVNSRDEAFAAIAAGNPEGAATFLGDWVGRTANAGDEPARLALAHALLATGAYERAESVLSGGKKPRGAAAAARLRVRARVRVLRGDTAGAEQHLREAVKAAPDELAAKGELLSLLVSTGRAPHRDGEASKLMDSLYDAYDASKATDAEGLIAVARAALARGSSGAFHDANMVLGEAEKWVDDAIAKPGADPLLFLLRDRLLLMRGAVFTEKYAANEAATTFALILQRDAWHADALAGLSEAFLGQLQIANAARAAEKVLQVNPHHSHAHGILARIALIEGHRAKARERVEKEIFTVNKNYDGGLAVMAGLAQVEGDAKGYARWRDQQLGLAADGGRFYTKLADLLVFMHLYPEVDTVLAEAATRAPKNPYVQSAHGLNLLRLGKEPQGREALARAWKRDRFNERTRNVLDLYDNRIDKAYTLKKSKQLELRLPTEDHELLESDFTASIQKARKTLDKRFGMNPGTLRLEVFEDPNEFSIRTIGVPSLGAVGVCFGPVITLVGNHLGTHNLDQVVWHELAHVYAIQLSKGRVPRWFTEGLSEWETEVQDKSWARESAELLVAARDRGKMRKLHELELAFLRAESPVMMEVAYSTAAYAVRYLGETYGLPALIKILRGYADGHTTEDLFKRHLGKDMATVEREFDTWFNGQLSAAVSGWRPTPEGETTRDGHVDLRDKLYRGALAKAQKGDLGAAARDLQALIATKDGDGFRPRMLLAEVLGRGPDWKAARPHLERARAFHRESIEPHVKLAELARREGDIAAEIAVLEAALAIDAGSYDPVARMLMLAVVSGDTKARGRALARAVAIAPLHPMTLSARAEALAGSDRARARAMFERATRPQSLEGVHPDTLVVAALAAAALGEKDAARSLATAARQHEKRMPAQAKKALDKAVGPAGK